MCPGTGHRICNDCMKACIFQKQEPVNIPQIETRVLTEVLALPWGLEIYRLLTRWNPLNVERPHARPYNGKNVLVVGLGPAGLHARAPPGVRGLRRRRDRRAEDRAARRRGSSATAGSAPAPDPTTSSTLYSRARRAHPARVRRRQRVRHHRSLGQELPHGPLRSRSRATSTSACTAASASAARSRSTTRGRSASTTSPSRRARAGRRSST